MLFRNERFFFGWGSSIVCQQANERNALQKQLRKHTHATIKVLHKTLTGPLLKKISCCYILIKLKLFTKVSKLLMLLMKHARPPNLSKNVLTFQLLELGLRQVFKICMYCAHFKRSFAKKMMLMQKCSVNFPFFSNLQAKKQFLTKSKTIFAN